MDRLMITACARSICLRSCSDRVSLYTATMSQRDAASRAAAYALAVLTFINLFNYLDRWVLSAVLEAIKRDLHFSDTQLGSLATGFIIVYMLTSPVFGTLGDRQRRPPLIALGVAIWRSG